MANTNLINGRTVIPAILILVMAICPSMMAYASWIEYKDISYVDVDGDSADEIIIKGRHGAGSNHYIEDMRIFKDQYPELRLIFSVRTLDSTYGFERTSPYNCDVIATVNFMEPFLENGTRDIIVKTKKIYYKDWENKVIDKEENLDPVIYKWNGEAYEASSMPS